MFIFASPITYLLAVAGVASASPIRDLRFRDTVETQTRFWEVNGRPTRTVATVTYPASDDTASAPDASTSFVTVEGPDKTVFSTPTSSMEIPHSRPPPDMHDADRSTSNTNMRLIYGLSVSLIVVVFLFCVLVVRMRQRIIATYTNGSPPIPRQFRGRQGVAGRPKKPRPVVLSDAQFALLPIVKAAEKSQPGSESTEFETHEAPKGQTTEEKPRITEGQGREEADMCAVCLETMAADDQLVELPCLHVYHIECIKGWLLKKSDSCPLCKQSVLAGLGLPRVHPAHLQPDADATDGQEHTTGVEPGQQHTLEDVASAAPPAAPAVPPAAPTQR